MASLISEPEPSPTTHCSSYEDVVLGDLGPAALVLGWSTADPPRRRLDGGKVTHHSRHNGENRVISRYGSVSLLKVRVEECAGFTDSQ